ncbi:MAG TPA: hypothetical protein VGH28_26570 [Polyangiaceae bacterium]|jgi:hypothetical protein
MFVVGICTLGDSGDDEARALAALVGGHPYEMRLKLAQPVPIVLFRTSDPQAAAKLANDLRARGHDAVALDEDAIAEPFVVRDFRLGETSLECGDGALAYGEVLALVRAAITIDTERVARFTERKLRPGAAIVTGGLVMTKKVTREEKHTTHDREELLYIFRGAGGRAWLLSERAAVYAALEGVARTQRENFTRVAGELRARAPAAWDERLLSYKQITDRRELDLRAHMIAIAAVRKLAYR